MGVKGEGMGLKGVGWGYLFSGQSQLLRYTCCAKKKVLRVAGKHIVSKQLALYD